MDDRELAPLRPLQYDTQEKVLCTSFKYGLSFAKWTFAINKQLQISPRHSVCVLLSFSAFDERNQAAEQDLTMDCRGRGDLLFATVEMYKVNRPSFPSSLAF